MSGDSKDEGCPSVWYAHVRIGMGIVWIMLTGMDLWVHFVNDAPRWSLIGLVITNVWGWLDAVLRFPILHEMDSLFVIKQLFMLLLKFAWLIMVYMRKKANPIAFVFCCMLAVIAPMIYTMVLPIDESEKTYNLIRSTYVDEDIAVRIWRVIGNPRESLRAFNRMRHKAMKRSLEEIAERSPAMAAKISDMSPSKRGMLRNPGRSV
eukprot:TRINITY_DN52072_c0_g1_i1.p1 TRINITY_DN52072_c0_g1~~TRINITY_DN52072_c0_g1_i1.p1  ORF type:complete len:206 (+),score=27.76 TRINITY_DN52072_c0_g1_i1:62-679(+)